MISKKVMTRIFRMFIGFLLLVVLIGTIKGQYSWSTFLAYVFGAIVLSLILGYNAEQNEIQKRDQDLK